MSRVVRNFFSNEEHASNVISGGIANFMVVGFVVAVAAVFLMR